jgi:hypothetical protein
MPDRGCPLRSASLWCPRAGIWPGYLKASAWFPSRRLLRAAVGWIPAPARFVNGTACAGQQLSDQRGCLGGQVWTNGRDLEHAAG